MSSLGQIQQGVHYFFSQRGKHTKQLPNHNYPTLFTVSEMTTVGTVP